MVGAPSFSEVALEFFSSIEGATVVFHNAAFHAFALLKAYSYSGLIWPSFAYGCSLAWSRRLLDLPSHGLPIVADKTVPPNLSQPFRRCDASVVAQVAVAMTYVTRLSTLEDLLHATGTRFGQLGPGSWVPFACPPAPRDQPGLPSGNVGIDPDRSLRGQAVLFTGALGSMPELVARDCVTASDGQVESTLTENTRLVVLGDGFSGNSLREFELSKKAETALRYRANGQQLEIWSEVDFIEALMTSETVPTHLFPEPVAGIGETMFPRPIFKSPGAPLYNADVVRGDGISPYWRWF